MDWVDDHQEINKKTMNRIILFLLVACASLHIQGQILRNQDITPEMVKAYQAMRPLPETWAHPTGPYAVKMEYNPTLMTHTIYRPENLNLINTKNEQMPIVLMSGPGCDCDGDSFRPFYTELASHGYIVIVAGPPVPEGTRALMWYNTPEDLKAGLDWILKENQSKDSPYYKKINTKKIALFGQSCGGIQCLRMADDPRISTLVFWNSGSTLMGNVGPTDNTKRLDNDRELMGTRDVQQLVLSLRIPVAYFVGDTDMALPAAERDFQQRKSNTFFAVRHIPGDSHAGTFREPNGGAFGEIALKWLNYTLKKDKAARQFFTKAPLSLGNDNDWIKATVK